MDIRLIVMDMDGTLLNSDQCIPEENLNALMEAQKKLFLQLKMDQ